MHKKICIFPCRETYGSPCISDNNFSPEWDYCCSFYLCWNCNQPKSVLFRIFQNPQSCGQIPLPDHPSHVIQKVVQRETLLTRFVFRFYRQFSSCWWQHHIPIPKTVNDLWCERDFSFSVISEAQLHIVLPWHR